MPEILGSKPEPSSEIKPLSLQDLNSQRLDALAELSHLEREEHRHPSIESRAAVLAKRLEIEDILQETLKVMDAQLDELAAKEKQGSGLSSDEQLRLEELRNTIEITQSRLQTMRGQLENPISNL